MAIIRASVRIPNDGGLAEDDVYNNFSFATGDVAPGTLADIRTALLEFYNVAVPGGNKLSDFLSDFLNGAGATVKMVNMSEPKPRFPLLDQAMPLDIPAGNGFPNEVAIVCSFQGAKVSGEDQARKRGRIYFGPVKSSTAVVSAGEMKVSSGVRDILNAAMLRLSNYTEAGLFEWVVYSAGARDNSDEDIPYKERPILPPEFANVTNGWTDDSFDTQRRRGRKASARTTWAGVV